MNETDLLQLAKRGLSPTASDAARVLSAVERALVAGVSAPTLAGRRLPARSTAKIATVLVVAATSGSFGYWLGYGAGSAAQARRVRVTEQRVTVAPAASVRAEIIEPSVPRALPEPASAAARVARAPSSTSRPVPVAPGESPLELETRLLTRVERALRNQNPRLALGLLGELDRTVPGGQLVEERRAGRVVAHCQLGSESAPELAREFLERFPVSAYAARVKQACDEKR